MLAEINSIADLTAQYPTEKDICHLLMDEDLLHKTAKCDKCGNNMSLRSRGSSYEWRCRVSKSQDCSSKSIKYGSFFKNTKLTLTQATKVMVMWSCQYTSSQISKEVGISERTTCDWRNFLREICQKTESTYGKIGGNDHIVEIDETNLHSRKYGVGKGTNEDWIFGGIDRESGKVFMKRVVNRSASVLVPLLQANVEKRSVVYSDEWRSYSQLKRYFTDHYTVCHKTQFINVVGTRRVCTNGVESMWSRLKKPFKAANGTSSALLDSYLSEFVCRENEKDDFFQSVINGMKIS